MKPVLRAFDFDGTITDKDSLICFIGYAKRWYQLLLIVLTFSIPVILMKVRLLPNWRVKQALFSFCFKGVSIGKFNRLCEDFAATHHSILRPDAIEEIKRLLKSNDRVCIVSASVDNWVKPFFNGFNVDIIGTQIEVQDQTITGRFLTKNCYGREKVNRLIDAIPDIENYYIVAYGDSRGDRELLNFASESHYKPFQNRRV